MQRRRAYWIGSVFAMWAPLSGLYAQRASENAITSAEDAFGIRVGNESIGLYDNGNVRGFSPIAAGNVRIEGLYFDQQASITSRVTSGSAIRVGLAAQGYPFPAPTGIVDISLRNSGADPALSAVASIGPANSLGIELDAQLPISADAFQAAAGVAMFRNQFGNGGSGKAASIGVVPRWRLTDEIEMAGYWGRGYSWDETAAPIYVPAGSYLPAEPRRRKYPGPAWATYEGMGENYGLLGTAAIDEWTVRFGIFRSVDESESGFANLFIDAMPDGTALRLLVADQPQRFASTSGELRVSRVIHSSEDPDALQHLLTSSFRTRSARSLFGGSDEVDYGIADIDSPLDVDKPTFNFGERTKDSVEQRTFGLSYGLRWRSVAESTVGVQHTRYARRTSTLGDIDVTSNVAPWLFTGTVAINIAKPLTAFGSIAQGLEDIGSAPDAATNRAQPLPALKTRQWDAGVRWNASDTVRVVSSLFEIKKPYVAVDRNMFYRQLGTETHRGIELSVRAAPNRSLTVVAGAVLQSPTVDGVIDANEVIGTEAVGQPKLVAQLNIDYLLPFANSVSVDASVQYNGRVAGTVDNLVRLPSYTTVSLSGRYKFDIGGKDASVRVSTSNLTNTYQWILVSGGSYQPLDGRSIDAYIVIDF